MLRTASIALLFVTLAGCTSSKAADQDPKPAAATSTTSDPARLGACRVLRPADIERPDNTSPIVDCAKPHTAQTFAVGTFPDALASDGRESPKLGSYVYDRCESRLQSFLGANDSLMLRSTLSWAWFRAPKDLWAKGRHTWRCEVVSGSEKATSYDPLPKTAKGILLGKPDDRWLVCVNGPTVTGSEKIPCSRPHTWRALGTIVLGKKADPYPGDRLSEVRTRDFCHNQVGAALNYPVQYDYGYTWFHAAEWKAGNRRSICWAKTNA